MRPQNTPIRCVRRTRRFDSSGKTPRSNPPPPSRSRPKKPGAACSRPTRPAGRPGLRSGRLRGGPTGRRRRQGRGRGQGGGTGPGRRRGVGRRGPDLGPAPPCRRRRPARPPAGRGAKHDPRRAGQTQQPGSYLASHNKSRRTLNPAQQNACTDADDEGGFAARVSGVPTYYPLCTDPSHHGANIPDGP